MIKVFEKGLGKIVFYKIVLCRSGDVVVCYVDLIKVVIEFNWYVEKGLEDMCVDIWNW